MSTSYYSKIREYHEYLWAIAPAHDMTGAYVDSDDLSRLLRSPTKATAAFCYENQIRRWLKEGPEPDIATMNTHIADDPKIAEIADFLYAMDDWEALKNRRR